MASGLQQKRRVDRSVNRALEPALGSAALNILAPTVIALALLLTFCPETGGVDLRNLGSSAPATA
jgi:hypothetical protein